MVDTAVFILATTFFAGAGFYMLAAWWITRREQRRLKRLARMLEGVGDDGEE